jgi:hypothetical protein
MEYKTKEDYELYLSDVQDLRDMLPQQIEMGWLRLEDLPSLEEHDKALVAMASAIAGGDLDMMLIEKTFLDLTMVKMSQEMLSSKMRIAETESRKKEITFN